MKRFLATVLSLSLALCALPALAQGDSLLLTAVVEANEAVALKAPASGELAPFTVRAGDVLAAGDAPFTVEPMKVYADMDGEVAAVYAKAGDIADAVTARYGAVLQMDYLDRYQVVASVRTGYDSSELRDPRVGTRVYLRSASNEKRKGEGRIIAVEGDMITVEVLSGDLVMSQSVNLYVDPEYTSKSHLARGSLSALPPRAIAASGTITKVAVRAGQRVKAGDFLFSYVPDALEPERRGAANATAARAEEALIVTDVCVQQGASVQKGQVLLMAVREGRYELRAQAEEGDVAALKVGDVMTARFEELEMDEVEAAITRISPLGTAGDVSKYDVTLSFDAPEGVWIGMHATVGKE